MRPQRDAEIECREIISSDRYTYSRALLSAHENRANRILEFPVRS